MNAQLTTQPTTAPTLEMIDPRTLTVDVNVRKDTALTPEFVASIKEHGVIEPVIAHRKDNGDGTTTVHVLMGQRRTRGAVEAGAPLIPVMVVASPEEAERITTQVVENVQRSALTDADEADAFHQLSLLGVSAAQIAKKTGRAKTHVEGALKARKSTAGEAALSKGRTIEEALVLVEFADDEDATAHLEAVLADEPDMLAHVAQQLRDDRAHQAARAALVAELEAVGTPIVDDVSWGYHSTDDNVRVTELLRADGSQATTEDANAVYINGALTVIPVVTGWKELGFKLRYNAGSAAPIGPMTDEQKAARKTLIANNKAMESATVVRRDFVKNLLAKKQAPKGWQYFTVHALTHHSEVAGGYEGAVAAEMAGAKIEGKETWGWNPLRDHVAKTTTRPEVPMIALICAGFEKTIAKDSWRSPHQSHLTYLTQLVTWGYTPSEVEQIILDSASKTTEPDEDTDDTESTEGAEGSGTFTEVHADEEQIIAEEYAAGE
ncbi:ParB/RepB/Spo0J family partition protein [Arthrobacter sedimenti]|uniref:ParB/RepB/Spo0J family partition protein n=1 Tax=Arthrobacter sedimenti TaxID=2694931 RepID=UPI000B35A7B9|nr:ParB/RepB/Spo0J family partition protein [Arthrobacter sedimenti]OUM44628.1 chromosome partitioning protein ParB [Arthrobacter agilis]